MWWFWGGFFDYANRTQKVEQDRAISLSTGFWDNNARATAILKDIKVNEYWIKLFNQVNNAVEDFAILFDFWKAGDATEEETIEAHKLALKEIEDTEFKSTRYF